MAAEPRLLESEGGEAVEVRVVVRRVVTWRWRVGGFGGDGSDGVVDVVVAAAGLWRWYLRRDGGDGVGGA
ncbi:hypothetical protein Tco_0433450 [Tanacetum coccineum]